MKELPFRTPVKFWSDGTYITVAQFDMYSRTKEGAIALKKGSDEFFEYLDHCRAYNTQYDMLEKDPTQGKMFWDDRKNVVGFSVSPKSSLDKRLRSMVPLKYLEDYDCDEDEDFEET